MNELRRHQLVWLDEFGWYRVLAAPPAAAADDPLALECLEHWAGNGWPLVVTQQACGRVDAAAPVALGLSAPARWGRKRIGLRVAAGAIRRRDEFPAAAELGPALPAGLRADWAALCEGFDRLGLAARIYGSHGWQLLTGLCYVHPQSDVDLLVPVTTAALADEACLLLQRAAPRDLRVDGELVFADGSAVAWREWQRWRGGQTASVLVKRIDGAALVDSARWTACA